MRTILTSVQKAAHTVGTQERATASSSWIQQLSRRCLAHPRMCDVRAALCRRDQHRRQIERSSEDDQRPSRAAPGVGRQEQALIKDALSIDLQGMRETKRTKRGMPGSDLPKSGRLRRSRSSQIRRCQITSSDSSRGALPYRPKA